MSRSPFLVKLLIFFYVSLYESMGFFLPILLYFIGYCYQQFLDGPRIEEINPNIELGNEVLEPVIKDIVNVVVENNPEIMCTDLGVFLFVGSCVVVPSFYIF